MKMIIHIVFILFCFNGIWGQQKQDYLHIYEDQGLVGFVSNQGKVVIPAQYDSALGFSEKIAAVYKNGKWQFIDEAGRPTNSFTFDQAMNFSEGLAGVGVGSKWGFVSDDGALKIEPIFLYVSSFRGRVARAAVSGKYYQGGFEGKIGFINKAGNFAIRPEFKAARDFSEGLAAVKKDSNWGFINKQGVMVIGTMFEWALDFSDGLAAVSINNKVGFIDREGNFVIEPKFSHAGSFSDGFASVTTNDQCSFTNREGLLISNSTFEECGDFAEGLASIKVSVTDDGKTKYGWGFINKQGKIVIEPKYRLVTPFKNGVSTAFVRNKRILIDKNGAEIVIQK